MNNAEIKRFVQEKIGQGVSKLEVLKILFQNNEGKRKRKIIKKEIEKFPTPDLEDNVVYKILKWGLLIIIAFLTLLYFMGGMAAFLGENAENAALLIYSLIGILFLVHIGKNSLNVFHWLSIISVLNIIGGLQNIDEMKKMGLEDGVGVMTMELYFSVAALIFSVIIIYKYFVKDNREWKNYVKENKL